MVEEEGRRGGTAKEGLLPKRGWKRVEERGPGESVRVPSFRSNTSEEISSLAHTASQIGIGERKITQST